MVCAILQRVSSDNSWVFKINKKQPALPKKTLIAGPIYGSCESENDEGMQHLLWSYDSTTKFDQLDFEWRPGMGEWQIKSLYPRLSNWFYKHRCAPWLPRGGFKIFLMFTLGEMIRLHWYIFLSNGLKPPTALLQYCFLLPGLVLLVATRHHQCPAQVDGLSVHSSLAVLVKHGRKGMDKSNKHISDREVWFWWWWWRWRWWVRCGDGSDTQNSKQKNVHTASLKFSHALTSSAHVTGTGSFDISH